MKQRKKLTSLLKLKNNAESRFIERIEFNNQRDLEVKTSQQSKNFIYFQNVEMQSLCLTKFKVLERKVF